MQPTITKHGKQAKPGKRVHKVHMAVRAADRCESPSPQRPPACRGVWVMLDDEWLPGGGGSIAQAVAALNSVFGGIAGAAAADGLLTWDQLAWEQLLALNLAKVGADGTDGVELTASLGAVWSAEFLEARELMGRIRVAAGAFPGQSDV